MNNDKNSDANKEELPDYIEDDSLDMIIMVFVLSAINPDDMQSTLTKLKKVRFSTTL